MYVLMCVTALQHWTYDIQLQYNGGEYTAQLLEYGRPTSSPTTSSKNLLLLVVLIPVMVPVCLIVIIVVVILACKVSRRDLTTSNNKLTLSSPVVPNGYTTKLSLIHISEPTRPY